MLRLHFRKFLMIFTCGLIHIGQKKSLNDTVHHFLEFTKYYFEIFEFSKLICCPQDTAIPRGGVVVFVVVIVAHK